MELPVTYVWTHDSIGLGEDGPTHQPIEHLCALRAIPGLDVVRPADANETAWPGSHPGAHRPARRTVLTRQNLPVLDRRRREATEGVAKGGYVLAEASNGQPQVILIATGSEVQIALDARELLEAEGIPTRVVSMPCVEWFNEQDDPTGSRSCPRDQGPGLRRGRASRCAGASSSATRGEIVSLDHFGACAPHTDALRAVRLHRRTRGRRGARAPRPGRRDHRHHTGNEREAMSTA